MSTDPTRPTAQELHRLQARVNRTRRAMEDARDAYNDATQALMDAELRYDTKNGGYPEP